MKEKFEEVRERLNGEKHEAFLEEAFGEYLTSSMTFTMGADSYTLCFYKGEVVDVIEGTPLTGIDFGIAGPVEGWVELYAHRNFSRAIAPKHGKLRHQGDLVRSMGNLNATAFVCRVLCEVVAGE